MIRLGKIETVLKIVRANDWWESKFGTFFAVIYATFVLYRIPFYELPAVIGFLLFSLLPGACFVSLINDLTDVEVDKLAGKKNRFETRSKKAGYLGIAICLVLGIVVSLFLSKISFFFYLLAWIIFSCYSVPPVRLKNRGILGVFADSLGAYVFPQFFAISVIADWFQKEPNLFWFVALGSWALCLGLRGIISHQLTDRKNDEKAKVKTFVQSYQNGPIKYFGTYFIFPLELAAFTWIIFLTQNYFVLILLAIYSTLSFLGYYFSKLKFAIVCSSKTERLFLSNFYAVFLPISFLLFGLLPLENSWLIIIFHVVLFAKQISQIIIETVSIFYCLYFFVREFLLGY